MNIKRKITKVKNWVKDHKGVIISGGLSVAALALGGVLLSKKQPKISSESDTEFEEYDLGRDCVMKFIVKDTQEELGEIECYESYAKDMLEDFR